MDIPNIRAHQSGPTLLENIYRYDTNHTTKQVEVPGYFYTLALRWLRERGDMITVFCWEGEQRKSPFRIARFIVADVNPNAIVMERVGEWHRCKASLDKKDETDVNDLVEEFVQQDGEIKWHGPHHKYVVLVDGKQVAKGLDKEEAQAVARGDMPIPKAA